LQPSLLQNQSVDIIPIIDCEVKNELNSYIHHILTAIASFISKVSEYGAARILIPNLFDIVEYFDIQNQESCKAIAHMIMITKHMIRSTNVVLVYTISSLMIPSELLKHILYLADSAISIESFAGKEDSIPIEFQEYCGYLHVLKVNQFGSLAHHRPAQCKYGLKRDRKKLHIQPLHLPPEADRGLSGNNRSNVSSSSNPSPDNTSTSHQTGKQKQPGNLCASNLTTNSGNGMLDF